MKTFPWIMTCLVCFHFLPAAAAAKIDAHNVVIVLDASGSMDGTMSAAPIKRMEAAKQALIEVVKTIPPDTHVGLLVFSAGNLENDWAYLLGPLDAEKLERAIRLPTPYGQTPLGAYIKKGADRLLEQRSRQFGYGAYRLLIVTDGEAQDQHLVDRYAPEAMARGITLDVIGVDMDRAHTLATRVHSYRSADDPESLTRALMEVFAEVGDTGTDAAAEEAFAEIESIPYDMALAMLKGLGKSVNNNTPLGEASGGSGLDAPLIDPADRKPAQSPSAPPASPPASVKDEGGSLFKNILIVVVAIIVTMSLRGKKRRGKRR